MELDPPDDFFELTTEDLVRLQQDANRRKQVSTQAGLALTQFAASLPQHALPTSNQALLCCSGSICIACFTAPLHSSLPYDPALPLCLASLQADTLFKPRAMREAEKAAVASSLGPIRVRLHFPGQHTPTSAPCIACPNVSRLAAPICLECWTTCCAERLAHSLRPMLQRPNVCTLPALRPVVNPADATIVQASFTASQPLSAVQQLVSQLALDAVAPALYLYSTPPKTVLKDPTATLYQLKLVPAAHLYVGCEHERLKAPAAAALAGGCSLSSRHQLLPLQMLLSVPCEQVCAMRTLALLQAGHCRLACLGLQQC